ncbi:MAG: co-chaperone GroES [Patescibacteria group bacterium]|jgi:chaperonin GroES
MKVKPLNDHVLVKATPKTEVTKSGIVIPETVEKERPEQGEVLAIGPGKLLEDGKRAPMSVKVGDQIMFKKYGPDEVKIDGQTLLILDESDIIAIME